jgi:DNA-binding NtrC family response regulator
MNLAQLERFRCRWANALDACQSALQIFSKLENRRRVADVTRSMAIVEWKRGHLADALAHAEEGISAAATIELPHVVAFAHELRALILIHLGDFGTARSQLEGIGGLVSIDPHARASLLTTEYLGDVQLEQGKAAEALKHYDEVWPKAMALVPRGDIIAELRRRRAECYLLLGRDADAYKAAREALEHCRELGDRYEEAATYRVLALSAGRMGKPDEAQQHFTQGFAYFDDIETPYEWGKLWMSYGDWLISADAAHHADRVAAREAYVAAREHFGHMGARAKLREAETRLAKLDESSKPPAQAASPASPAAPPDPASPKKKSAIAPAAPRRPAAQSRLDARSEWAWQAFNMITRHEPLLDLLDRAIKLAPSGAPTLVTGETGTGKELIAAGLHRHSKVTGHYISLNCAAVPKDMIESEMFGHARGAFSGAIVERVGMVEAAADGTLFLDEVGEMSDAMQAKLLRFLESGEFRRVGESMNRHVKTNVVAATNVPRARLAEGGGFRGDLYWRLAQAVLEVPALRHRPGDVRLLIDHFLRLESKKMGKSELVLSDTARTALERYGWPGNVRELVGVVRRAVALAERSIEVSHLDLASTRPVAVTLTEELAAAERLRIEHAMRDHGNSPTSAARALGIPRTTLVMKLKRLGIREQFLDPKPRAE